MTTNTRSATGEAMTRRAILAGTAAAAASVPALVQAAPSSPIFEAFQRWRALRADYERSVEQEGEACERFKQMAPKLPAELFLRHIGDYSAMPRKFWHRLPAKDGGYFCYALREGWEYLTTNPPLSAAGTPWKPGVEWVARGLEACRRYEAAYLDARRESGLDEAEARANVRGDQLSEVEAEIFCMEISTPAELAVKAAVMRASFDGLEVPEELLARFLAETVAVARWAP